MENSEVKSKIRKGGKRRGGCVTRERVERGGGGGWV